MSTATYHKAPGNERELVNRLMQFMQQDAEAEPAVDVLTVENAIQETAPVVNNDKPIPLTW